MEDEREELSGGRLADEIERAALEEPGPVVHSQPLRIPGHLLEGIAAAAVAPRESPRDRWILKRVPMAIVGTLAILWTLAAYARHDTLAYAIGFALALIAVAEGWARSKRP